MKSWIKTVVGILIAWWSFLGPVAQASLCSDMAKTPPYVSMDTATKETQASRARSNLALLYRLFTRLFAHPFLCGIAASPSMFPPVVLAMKAIQHSPSDPFLSQFIPDMSSPPSRVNQTSVPQL
ncbi:hypothetical protein [Allopusillimonas ginsengisoli]|uniref:hypothetical protein n=1 Tax=Allopusillimonas ginsengisoli TaxID=453575 RepID=UPI00101FD054|nr:hypothetical protein [Allopusillimonas ginsengisoli]TEA79266.1 hypothetical protein ERE07_07795 [Allopusillimonas ginsengisoli]